MTAEVESGKAQNERLFSGLPPKADLAWSRRNGHAPQHRAYDGGWAALLACDSQISPQL